MYKAKKCREAKLAYVKDHLKIPKTKERTKMLSLAYKVIVI